MGSATPIRRDCPIRRGACTIAIVRSRRWSSRRRRRQQPVAPPGDAIVLFDGKDLSHWEGGNPQGIEDGCINILKTGQIQTEKKIRRLPTARRMGHAREGRRRRHDLGQ